MEIHDESFSTPRRLVLLILTGPALAALTAVDIGHDIFFKGLESAFEGE